MKIQNQFVYNKPLPPINNSIHFNGKVLFSQTDSLYKNELAKSISYISKVRAKLLRQGKELSRLEQLNLEKLSGITDGLKTFENISMRNLGLIKNILILNTQVGCNNSCVHCYLQAKPTAYYNSPLVANTMDWETCNQIVNDFEQLNKRLGFNILGNKFKYLYNYADSDPISYCSMDKSGNKHNIAEISELFYDKLGKHIDFSTAGWDVDNEFENKAAQDIVKKVLKRPEMVRNIDVSIHSFQKDIHKSNFYFEKSIKETDQNKAEYYRKKHEEFKDKYIERMAQVLKTFLPLLKTDKFHIDTQYLIRASKQNINSKPKVQELCNEILERLEKICLKDNIDCSELTKEKNIDKNKYFYPTRHVFLLSRMKIDKNNLNLPSTFKSEITNGTTNIVVEPFDKEFFNFFENEISDILIENIKKDKNFVSKVIINIDLDNNTSSRMVKNGILTSAQGKENLYERIENTLQKYSSLPQDKLLIRLRMNDNEEKIVSQDEIRAFLKNRFSNIKIKEEENNINKDILSNDSTEDFFKLLNNFPPEKRKVFISEMTKGYDIDGNLMLTIYNTPYFGFGPLEKMGIKLDGLKLNIDSKYNLRDNKYPLLELN